MYELQYTERFLKQLLKFNKKTRKHIFDKIGILKDGIRVNNVTYIKYRSDYNYRLRIGKYRVFLIWRMTKS